jgi:hypothetical protein
MAAVRFILLPHTFHQHPEGYLLPAPVDT